ncbi:MAG: hypothetical protein K2Q22_09645, partial [Cytophagales bacterium]|nr:hypothetical protein [Cytophagales bacterium]
MRSTGNGSCTPVTSTVTIFVTAAPSITPLSNVKACANNPVVTLTGAVSTPFGGTWSSGGSGTISGTGITAVYRASATDITIGTVPLTFTSTGNGQCKAVSQTISLTFDPSPSVTVGSNKTVCANNPSVVLNGGVSGGASGITWLGGNTAGFNPSRTSLTPTYTPTAAEIASGLMTLSITSTGNLSNCFSDTKSMTIAFTPAPTANPGSPFTVCANNPNISLSGRVLIGGVTTTGIWTGGSGGSFNPNNSLNTIYTPSAADISAGSVLFTLTPNNVGNCLATPSSVLVGFTPAPVVNPGPTQTVCSNVGFVNLNGSVSISGASTTGIWAGGLGTFTPVDQTVLNTRYFPTAAEISSGSVSLTLTSTNSTSGCNAVSSTVAINFTPNPVVSAGGNQTVCGNSFTPITLNGTVKNAPSFSWTYNGTGSFVNTNTLTPSYTPNAADQAKGTITFKLTSSGGSCASVTDSMKISFSNAPIANAGSPINICTNAFPIQLNASGSPGSWSGGPSANFSPSVNALNAIYTPTAAQTVTGSFSLTYTTNASAGCAQVFSSVTINVTQGPSVDAGNKTIVCANNPTVSLSGIVNNSVGQKWSTSGTGTFSPNANVTNPVYTPSNADIFAGRVLLTLASQGGSCTNSSDTLSVIITPAPVVTAMANQLFCSNISTLTLSGSVSNAGGGVWTRSGTGNFNGNSVAVQSITGTGNMATNYTPSASDLSSSFTISLTSSLNGLCSPVTKSFTVGFSQAPIVVAGANRTICSDKDTLQLLGQITNAAGGFWTSLSPSPGSFSNPAILNPIYTPSASELAASSFTLRLTSQGNFGSCSSASNDVTFSVSSKPNPIAGSNSTICADVTSVPLSASINFPYGTQWSTSGTGTFTGGLATSTLTNVNYFPSATDLSGGAFTI